MRLLRCSVLLAFAVASSSPAWGQTSAVRATTDTGDTAGVAVVTGVVFDSVGRAPLADALVQMRMEAPPRRVFSAITDATGAYRIEQVPRGQYLVSFFHPALDTLGLQPMMWHVEVRDSVTRLMYAVPSPATIWMASCRPTNPNDSTGLVLGHVYDADTHRPIAGSVVSVTWTELVIDHRGPHLDRRQLAEQTNDEGLYALCGVPSEVSVLVRAEHGAASSGVVEVTAPLRGIARRDLGIGSSDSTVVAVADSGGAATRTGDGTLLRRGTARIDGIVRSPKGDPLKDVQLVVRGTDVGATSDAGGHFALTGLPPGTYTLEARHLGFAQTRVVVDLASHHTNTVAVTMDKEVPVLNTVQIYGKRRSTRSSLTGFLERRKQGFGHFLTRADIQRQHPIEFTDLFRMIPGVRVVPTRDMGHALVMRGGAGFGRCQPVIYVDGMRLFSEDSGSLDWMVNPQEITGMEVYTGPSQAPVQYRGEGCGSVVIWTGLAP